MSGTTRYAGITRALERAGQLVSLPDPPPGEVSGVVDDSRAVKPGFLFCAVRGSVDDGRAYVGDAVSRGASGVIVAERVSLSVPQIVVRDDRAATAIAAAEWYGRPADRLDILGVTGTNGKSTTVALIRHLLNEAGDAGSVGTLGAFDGAGEALPSGGLTTPGVVGLQATLAAMVDRGVRSVAMEVSSHALDQRRVEGIAFRAATFTNLTREHLDYHGTFRAYREAKYRLADYLRPDGVVVVNGDEPAWKAVQAPPSGRRITFGHAESGAQVRAGRVDLGRLGADLAVHIDGSILSGQDAGGADREYDVHLPLIGGFNVTNALAAVATVVGIGAPPDAVTRRLADAPQVPGRMERLAAGGLTILRDYAHTPDALERAIGGARALTAGRLIVLFGCGGDRDRGKRSAMGRIAARGADLAVVTSDNPRTEEPDAILDDIVAGMAGHAYLRMVDRREAIGRAVGMLDPDDCLLLAGKGHETYQVVGTRRLPFDEAEIVRDAVMDRSAR